jgi:hypothetical protein
LEKHKFSFKGRNILFFFQKNVPKKGEPSFSFSFPSDLLDFRVSCINTIKTQRNQGISKEKTKKGEDSTQGTTRLPFPNFLES